ncbi:MAG TPA: metallophosphoesterase [Stellaceae bacterium]|nr:metallophosphoesterase [Stellaceae bacterium]
MPAAARLLAAACGLIVAALAAQPAAAKPIAGPWVELGPDGTASVREVVASGVRACPRVVADGNTVEARQRGAADGAFPITVCATQVPANTKHLTVDGKTVPIVPPTIRRIVVFGDTGCRVLAHFAQDCNDPKAWPFPTIARLAAARHPDLVIHVGDYYYREAACPTGSKGCPGTPHGDNWEAWKADFFDPAEPLLAAAPWVMSRGNHELCRRGGKGWFRLLDRRPMPVACDNMTAPYRIETGGLSLLMFDDADADDFTTEPKKVAAYAAQLAGLLRRAPPHSWLVTHRPVWALAMGNLPGVPLNLTGQAAIRGHVPPTLDMVVSGHLHDFASYQFGPKRPSQLIAGTGGDTLLPVTPIPLAGETIDGLKVQKGMTLARFGYFVMDRAETGWNGTFYGIDDGVLARCHIAARTLDCR